MEWAILSPLEKNTLTKIFSKLPQIQWNIDDVTMPPCKMKPFWTPMVVFKLPIGCYPILLLSMMYRLHNDIYFTTIQDPNAMVKLGVMCCLSLNQSVPRKYQRYNNVTKMPEKKTNIQIPLYSSRMFVNSTADWGSTIWWPVIYWADPVGRMPSRSMPPVTAHSKKNRIPWGSTISSGTLKKYKTGRRLQRSYI